MNKLSKIFLGIIIVLVIFIGVIMYKNYESSKENLQTVLDSAEKMYQVNKAVYEAGFSLEEQEDGTYKLVQNEEE